MGSFFLWSKTLSGKIVIGVCCMHARARVCTVHSTQCTCYCVLHIFTEYARSGHTEDVGVW